jgi:hypothetical protein
MNEQQRHAFEEALHQKFTGIPLSDEEVNLARWGWQAALAQREPVAEVKRYGPTLYNDGYEDRALCLECLTGQYVHFEDWQRTEAARLAADNFAGCAKLELERVQDERDALRAELAALKGSE